MAEKEFMFFNSTLVQYWSDSFFLTDMFTSHLICHFSMSASAMSLYLTILWSSLRNSTTSSELVKSGLVTISTRGVPARLKSNSASHHWWIILPVSHSMWASCMCIILSCEYSLSTKNGTCPLIFVGLYSCVIWYHIGRSG